jgi:3-hydroxybutyryl-CoA dehydrogenase
MRHPDDPAYTLGVVGCGAMGQGIAQVAAQGGMRTILFDAREGGAAQARERIGGHIDRMAEKGRVSPDDAAAAKGRLEVAEPLAALADCDAVVEAIFEDLDAKQKLFGELEAAVRADCLLASNTSSIPIASIARACRHRARIAGLHFFNPVPLMKLVEVARTILTDDGVVKTATEWVRAVGKVPVQTKDATAFIVNRLLVPYLLDAVRVYEGGLASLEDIDQAMKLGCGYPMGPFTLLDLVGLDTALYVAEVMFDEFREPRYAPPALLKRMVLAGHLGRKTGRGFYTYGA